MKIYVGRFLPPTSQIDDVRHVYPDTCLTLTTTTRALGWYVACYTTKHILHDSTLAHTNICIRDELLI